MCEIFALVFPQECKQYRAQVSRIPSFLLSTETFGIFNLKSGLHLLYLILEGMV